MKKSSYRVPFDLRGNLMQYASEDYPEYAWVGNERVLFGPTWKEPEPFEATLMISGMSRGRSSAIFEWQDADGHQYPMFMTDMLDTLAGRDITKGTVSGRWIPVKRGSNFGIKIAPEEVDK